MSICVVGKVAYIWGYQQMLPNPTMKIKYLILILLTITLNSCQGQKPDKKIHIFDRNTGLTMNLPEGFEELNENESEKILSKGKKVLIKFMMQILILAT